MVPSKFVKGDAIAGILISIYQLCVGGLIDWYGAARFGSFSHSAVEIYTLY